ncbi:hypothetical protein PIB30_014023 [Stylosanthes scabra]|uniref:Uncharacterized protein n=1 Tax=Stylosanthes scabra TaxID=79078 RepID=A0ABU6Z720_9FABA|nr:hypothetical protein [Stylosanthes scabra]
MKRRLKELEQRVIELDMELKIRKKNDSRGFQDNKRPKSKSWHESERLWLLWIHTCCGWKPHNCLFHAKPGRSGLGGGVLDEPSVGAGVGASAAKSSVVGVD